MAGKGKTRNRGTPKYIIHRTHLSSWFEDYDDCIKVEGRSEALRAVMLIREHLRKEFPRATIPHREFEFPLGKKIGRIHVPIREHICLASEQVALITGLSIAMTIQWDRITPDDFTAPVCVIDAVTGNFTNQLSAGFARALTPLNYPGGDTLRGFVDDIIDYARVQAVCAAVDTLDGTTPDCNRELIQFMIRPRLENGPPDPFSSKSRFRNSLMEALIWFPLPKKDYPHKPASKITMDDLAYYFCQLGYLGNVQQSAIPPTETDKRLKVEGTGGDDRTIRRWMRKYTDPKSNWPALRSDLITIIRRTGYNLI